MKVVLKSLGGEEGSSDVNLDWFPFIVGRGEDCDGRLGLQYISRRHCKFTVAGPEVLVQDLGSHNGTAVNGRLAFQPLPIQDGDELAIGPLPFRVVMPGLLASTAKGGHACYREPEGS